MANKAAITHVILQYEGLYRISPMLDQFKNGLEKAGILNLIKNFPYQFANCFTFHGHVNSKDVIELLQSSEDNEVDEKTMHLLCKYIDELDEQGIIIIVHVVVLIF